MLTVARRPRLIDEAAERIQQLINQQAIKPGSRLPSERDLATQLGLGRTSIREGLRTLEMVGLIETVPGKGIFLRESLGAPFKKLIQSWLSLHKGTVQELIELREAIETQAAYLTAMRAAPKDIHDMVRAVEVMRQATEVNNAEGFVEADNNFHDIIARTTGNSLLRRSLASIAHEIQTFRLATALIGPSMLARSLSDHEKILAAIKSRDPAAAQLAMREHIVRTPKDFKLFSDEPDPATPDKDH
jgi:GntR family transcriptional regulator, transcriptional repressor for pyruvate dehydrogenase complex